MRHPVAALLLSTLPLLAPALPAAAEGLFGAIAFSPSTGVVGGSWNQGSDAAAKGEANNNCGTGDCYTVAVFQQCGAIAVGVDYGMGYHTDASSAVASETALANCSANSSGCEVTMSFCNEGN